MKIKLEFCIVWNYTPRAVSTVEDILEKYGKDVTSIDLIPGTGGVFELYIDGVLIYSKLETGRHTNEGEILQLMEKALSWHIHSIYLYLN